MDESGSWRRAVGLFPFGPSPYVVLKGLIPMVRVMYDLQGCCRGGRTFDHGEWSGAVSCSFRGVNREGTGGDMALSSICGWSSL
jgi:hypothetical protein